MPSRTPWCTFGTLDYYPSHLHLYLIHITQIYKCMCKVAHPHFTCPSRVSHHSRKSSRHPPPPNPHIHRNVPRKGVECERFRRRVSTGSSADSSPGFRAGRCFRSRTVNFRADLPLGSRLPLRRLDPTSIVGHPPWLLRLHACSIVPRTTTCMPLTPPLRSSMRRYASVSDSRVDLLMWITFTCRHQPLVKVSRRLSDQPPDWCEDLRRTAPSYFYAA